MFLTFQNNKTKSFNVGYNCCSVDPVEPPEVDCKRVAFVYLFYTDASYHIIHDFTPNVPDELLSKEEKEKWELGKYIADSIQDIIVPRRQLKNTIAFSIVAQ